MVDKLEIKFDSIKKKHGTGRTRVLNFGARQTSHVGLGKLILAYPHKLCLLLICVIIFERGSQGCIFFCILIFDPFKIKVALFYYFVR